MLSIFKWNIFKNDKISIDWKKQEPQSQVEWTAHFTVLPAELNTRPKLVTSNQIL